MVYLGYVIGGGEHKIDPTNIEAITKWSTPTNVTKVRIFLGETQYLQKFLVSFSVVAAPLHVITTSSKGFQKEKNQHKSFEEIK